MLVTGTIFVALFASSVLIIPRIDNIFDESIGNNAVGIAAVVSKNPLVIEYLKNESHVYNTDIYSTIKTISMATNANIALLDANKKILFEVSVEAKKFEVQINDLLENNYSEVLWQETQRVLYIPYAMNPVTDEYDNTVGYIIVGSSESQADSVSTEGLMLVALSNFIALLVGLVGAMFTAKSIKDILLGLEPEEVAKMVQEKTAILNSVREGVIATDAEANITLINKEARKILATSGITDTTKSFKGIANIYHNPHIKEVLETGTAQYDVSENINGVIIILNVFPIFVGEKIVGTVTTFRKKTDVEALAQELTGVRNYADALRANTHEFMNKMHVILGLIEMEEFDDLRSYVREIADYRQEEIIHISSHIENPVLAGFIVGKINRAKELGIEFILSDDSEVKNNLIPTTMTHKIILILGNLITNAFDVLAQETQREKIVFLTIRSFEDAILLIVEDSGPGINEAIYNKIFDKGVSSKGTNRGIGLYLVKQIIDELGGSIEIDSQKNQGTIFTIKLTM